MMRFILLLGVLAGVASQTTCAPLCVQGVCHDNLCACASGAYTNLSATDGLQCQLSAPSQCVFANISNLATDFPPVLDTSASTVKNDTLHVVAYSPLINSRIAVRLYFGDANNATLYPECAFPGPYWVKTIDTTGNCQEVYTADIPWATAALCGWTIDRSQANMVVYKNYLFVRHDDQLGTLRGTPVLRDTTHSLPIQITFRTVVDVSTSLNVFAPVNLLAAVTLRTYDPAISRGKVNILTSLQWPFYLASVSIGSVPALLSAAASGSDVDCVNNTGNACAQLYTVIIDPNSACTLSGSYQLDFVLGCRGDPTQCPLDSNTSAAAIYMNMNSEDFCNGVQINIGLSGSLSVFDDSAFTNSKNIFFHQQPAYFRASLSNGGSLSIVSSTIEQVRVSSNNETRFLYDQNVTSDGNSMSFSLINSAATSPSFSFVPNDIVMPILGDASNFTVYATIRVSYAGGVTRRLTFIARQNPSSTVSGDYSITIEIQYPPPTPTPSQLSPSPTPQPTQATLSSLTLTTITNSGQSTSSLDLVGSSSALVASALLLML